MNKSGPRYFYERRSDARKERGCESAVDYGSKYSALHYPSSTSYKSDTHSGAAKGASQGKPQFSADNTPHSHQVVFLYNTDQIEGR